MGDENRLFNRRVGTHIRFDTCRNEECQASIAVVFSREGTEVDTFPSLETEPDELLPDDVRTAFRQALQSLNERIWDGCVLMCRRALEEATTDLGGKGKVLYEKIEYLAKKNLITPDLQQWAHETRLAGKLGAHGAEAAEKKWNDESDAEEIVEFCRWFFRYVYVLPKQLAQRRERLAEGEQLSANGPTEEATYRGTTQGQHPAISLTNGAPLGLNTGASRRATRIGSRYTLGPGVRRRGRGVGGRGADGGDTGAR
ncbi:MAG: DUF4145 domain-containing protein [Dehalococcoidia bacterium]